MQIGISVGNRNYEIYAMLKECGFDCADVDLSSTETPFYTLNEKAYALIEKERIASETAGIKINQVHGPWRCPPKDSTADERNERMEKMKKAIKFTAELGCENFVIHPIMPFGLNEAGTPEAKKTYEINLEFMKELLAEAKKNNVVICLENMPFLEYSLSKPSEILKLVKEINDSNFKICLDTGHVAVFNELSVGDVVRELGSEIKVLHVHDNSHQIDLHLPPFYGRIDWNDFTKALFEIQYKGVFSFELYFSSSNSELKKTAYKYYADIAKYLISDNSL